MDFDTAFKTLKGYPPYCWQKRLYDEYFSKGEIPSALDLPTGLGKTSVMAIWLAARALCDADTQKKLPRRLVYVVDRRAVVDQATDEAEGLRDALEGENAAALKKKLGVGAESALPISTLRGQHVDNREWLTDPVMPAIIVGTVDMIGSRLLFEGYGVSRKMRPYHAGLLGADALIVLDEAHLVPSFEKLIAAIEKGQQADYENDCQKALGPRMANERRVIPPLRLMSLSATGREREGKVFRLKEEDRDDALVNQRLDAKKSISIRKIEGKERIEEALVEAAWALSEKGTTPVRCLIYCDKREIAQKVYNALSDMAEPTKKGEAKKAEVELFTGARRFFEREIMTAKLKNPLGFIAGEVNKTDKPVFLVATSAAEVGVDLDADHMVCDIVAWERMAQRFGRVNRRGEGDAKIVVIEPSPKKADAPTEAERRTMLAYRSLEVIGHFRKAEGGGFDASPASLLELKSRAAKDGAICAAIEAATTPPPLYPALNRALVDAWSMTSLETHAGRPEVGPWLRGWVDEDGPQTAVVWRSHLPIREGGMPTNAEIDEFFEAAPPHVSERLETETYAVVDWLVERAKLILPKKGAFSSASEAVTETDADQQADAETDKAAPEPIVRAPKQDDIVAFALSPAREFKKSYRLEDFSGDKKIRDTLEKELAGATLIVDARFGGLSGGLLDSKSSDAAQTADDGDEWLWEEEPSNGAAGVPLVKFRVQPDESGEGGRESNAEGGLSSTSDWHKPFRFALSFDGDGNTVRNLVVEKWRGASTMEDERSVSRPQTLDEHQDWARTRAEGLANRLALSGNLKAALTVAARLHDEGKRAERWQRAFKAPRDAAKFGLAGPLAKTKGPIDQRLLDGYRHEFGSLPFVEKDEGFQALSDEMKDLVLHLVAAHHGAARPVIEMRNCEDAPPSALQERAHDVALRFARLQSRWGPWGLAWLEALLRAADQQASRENDEGGRRATIEQPADEAERA